MHTPAPPWMTSFPNRLPCVPDCAALRSCSSLPIYLPACPSSLPARRGSDALCYTIPVLPHDGNPPKNIAKKESASALSFLVFLQRPRFSATPDKHSTRQLVWRPAGIRLPMTSALRRMCFPALSPPPPQSWQTLPEPVTRRRSDRHPHSPWPAARLRFSHSWNRRTGSSVPRPLFPNTAMQPRGG